MTVTLHPSGRSQPTAAVVTTDGTIWSWSDLFDQFAPAIRSFARSRGAHSPDDIVQDVFTTAVERFPLFEGDASGLRSFLFTLAYRRIADDHRSARWRHEELVSTLESVTVDQDDMEESLAETEAASEALRALEILGGRERRVIEMRIFDEASPAQVAKALGISNGNVRVIQARALVKIRKYLEARAGTSTAGAMMPAGGSIVTFLRGLRADLPSDGNLVQWIEVVHSSSSHGAIQKAVAGAGSAIAAGAATSSIAGTALKVGLIIALATMSTSPQAVGSVHRESVSRLPSGINVPAATPTESFQPANPPMVIDAPTSGVGVASETPQRNHLVTPSVAKAEASVEESSPSASDLAETAEDLATSTLEDDITEATDSVVEPLVTVVDEVVEAVDTVVDDVVQPVVDTTTEIVDDTVDTVNETVDTVVDEVDEVVDEVDETVDEVEDEVDETVEEVEEIVEDVTGLVGGLLP